MRALPMLLLLLTPLLVWGAITDQPAQIGAASTYEEIQTACTTLLQAGPQGNFAPLSKYYGVTTNTEIREAIAAASALYWMMRQQLANAERDVAYLRKNFPDSKYQSLVDKDANLIACTNCHDGVAMVLCTDCGGTGKCRTCGGRGKVAGITGSPPSISTGDNLTFARPGTAGAPPNRTLSGSDTRTLTVRPLGTSDPAALQPCPLCNGSGGCPACKGTKLARGHCPICQGFGTVFTPRTRIAYADVLSHLRDLALRAGMAERGMTYVEGHWLDAKAATRLRQRRHDEHADFVRATTEAERAKDYATAYQLLDNALIRHADSSYTADVQRVKLLLQTDASNKKITDKAERGADQMARANMDPRRETGIIIEGVLIACRRGTNAPPLLIASNAVPVLPENPAQWKIGEPELLDRTARVSVKIDRPSRSGFLITEPWEFRLNYENIQWKVWQAVGPEQPLAGQ